MISLLITKIFNTMVLQHVNQAGRGHSCQCALQSPGCLHFTVGSASPLYSSSEVHWKSACKTATTSLWNRDRDAETWECARAWFSSGGYSFPPDVFQPPASPLPCDGLRFASGIYDFANIRNVTNSHMNKRLVTRAPKTSLLLKPMVTWGSSILRNFHFC